MIDLNLVRENPEAYIQACKKKRIKFDIPAFLKLDEEVRSLKTTSEQLRAEQNQVSKVMPTLKGEEKEAKLAEMKVLAANVKQAQSVLLEKETEWAKQQLLLPSIPLGKVPDGKDDSENVEIKKWGKLPEFNFAPKDHATLGIELDGLDMERGVKIAGSRSYFLKGDFARLQHAIMQYALNFIYQKNYIVMDPPHLVSTAAMEGTGYFPGGEESAYHLDERDADTHLIGTSEVPVASYHMDEILDASTLPRRYAGYSPCYRREAGTYGKDTSGIYRVHQFYKVEQVVICKNDDEESARIHAELLGNSEQLLQNLNLHYRVVDVCGGDMGQGQAYKNDIECWMPSRNNYGETHSCSTFNDFQARRLKIRYRNEEGKSVYCHTLNNTLVASPRILIAVIENYQTAEGQIVVPEVLRPYMGGQSVIG